MLASIGNVNEKELLLKKIFPYPYASVENPPILLKICKELGDEYCVKFDDTGFTKNYERCDPDQVIQRAAKLFTDDNLLVYCERFKDHLNKYFDFKGEHYTYSYRTKMVSLESIWPRLEKKLHDLMSYYPGSAEAVLEAIWEVNMKHDKKSRNYYPIQTVAKKKGLGRGWFKILSELDLMGVIDKHKGNISIPEEMIEFWRRFLELLRE